LEAKGQEKERVFEVPLKYVSFQLLNDPKCPLQLSNPKVIRYKSGNIDYYYTITNNSLKSVKSFQVKAFDAFVNPSHEYTLNPTANDEYSFLPQESFSTLSDQDKLEIIELDEKRVAEFGLSEKRKRVRIVIVTKVELYDGTKYDATSKYSRIKKFVEQIENEEYEAEDDAPKSSAEEKETKLRNFITEEIQKGEKPL
jgi:hypothetical protein